MSELRNSDIIYKDLSYKLMGVLFEVHRTLGNNYQEKYYQRAVERGLKLKEIPYKRELLVKMSYKESGVGRYFIDFVIADKIALEIKATANFKRSFFNQLYAYLDLANLKLGIITNFRSKRLYYKRLVNPRVKLIS